MITPTFSISGRCDIDDAIDLVIDRETLRLVRIRRLNAPRWWQFWRWLSRRHEMEYLFEINTKRPVYTPCEWSKIKPKDGFLGCTREKGHGGPCALPRATLRTVTVDWQRLAADLRRLTNRGMTLDEAFDAAQVDQYIHDLEIKPARYTYP